ncbi:hypothetical protein BJ508DRAFT_311091 [Ascobolus immersus RN42]|uniref:Uncharacterized protein n=1 Tax=Ascobolus immersus RN42 TaxID=1160509 RepID=A0A3N4HXA4_ASCIM|nr:hypothetical protein BJ508DRAFT_311091 [Ascobolus immersus RN42]
MDQQASPAQASEPRQQSSPTRTPGSVQQPPPYQSNDTLFFRLSRIQTLFVTSLALQHGGIVGMVSEPENDLFQQTIRMYWDATADIRTGFLCQNGAKLIAIKEDIYEFEYDKFNQDLHPLVVKWRLESHGHFIPQIVTQKGQKPAPITAMIAPERSIEDVQQMGQGTPPVMASLVSQNVQWLETPHSGNFRQFRHGASPAMATQNLQWSPTPLRENVIPMEQGMMSTRSTSLERDRQRMIALQARQTYGGPLSCVYSWLQKSFADFLKKTHDGLVKSASDCFIGALKMFLFFIASRALAAYGWSHFPTRGQSSFFGFQEGEPSKRRLIDGPVFYDPSLAQPIRHMETQSAGPGLAQHPYHLVAQRGTPGPSQPRYNLVAQSTRPQSYNA